MEFKQFLAEKQLKPRSIHSYVADVNSFKLFLGTILNKQDSALLTSDVQAYADYLKQKRYKPSSLRRKIISVAQYWAFLKSQGTINIDLGKISFPPSVQKTPEPINIGDIKFDPTKSKLRDFIIFLVIIKTGMKISVLQQLLVSQVDLSNKILKYGEPEKQYHIDPEMLVLLSRYINGRDQSSVLFSNKFGQPLSERGIRRVLSGIHPSLNPMNLRHSFAIDQLKKGATILDLQRMFGHSSESLKYLYGDYETKELGPAAELEIKEFCES